jgi:hypothetical protein
MMLIFYILTMVSLFLRGDACDARDPEFLSFVWNLSKSVRYHPARAWR